MFQFRTVKEYYHVIALQDLSGWACRTGYFAKVSPTLHLAHLSKSLQSLLFLLDPSQTSSTTKRLEAFADVMVGLILAEIYPTRATDKTPSSICTDAWLGRYTHLLTTFAGLSKSPHPTPYADFPTSRTDKHLREVAKALGLDMTLAWHTAIASLQTGVGSSYAKHTNLACKETPHD